MKNLNFFSHFKQDFPASIIVFLVAMPLCLGIALASGAPLFSGLIAGMIGGIVVGLLSGSALGVSGPAAGLAVIVLSSIQELGGFEIFLLAVVISGVFQLLMGFLKTGVIAYYFPSSVIMGMLSAIGIIIFLKQVPHAFGYDAVPEGDMTFQQADHENTFSEILHLLDKLSYGPMIIAALSLMILITWETKYIKKYPIFNLIQGPLVAVVLGIILNILFTGSELLSLSPSQVVNIPIAESFSGFMDLFRMPDFSQIMNPQVYLTAAIIAVVGSIETLLCVEASDKLDPERRLTPRNRELKAQGVGNIISGLIGGLPITQVIVRSSVNLQAGARTKASAVFHGLIILLAIITIPNILNKIPLATLASILIVVGYKLAKPTLFKKKYKQGWQEFVPFMATILGIVFTDLLVGIGIGFAVATVVILYQNLKIPIIVDDEIKKDGLVVIELPEDVTFFKKASLHKVLSKIPNGRHVKIDATKTYYIHQDVLDLIEDFQISARSRNITIDLIELYEHKDETPHLHYRVEEKQTSPQFN